MTLVHRQVGDIATLLLIAVLITFGPHPDSDICRCRLQGALAPAFLSGPLNVEFGFVKGVGRRAGAT